MGASPASHRPARIAYANGQRLCFIDSGASWRVSPLHLPVSPLYLLTSPCICFIDSGASWREI